MERIEPLAWPALFQASDSAANRDQARYFRTLKAELSLGIGAVALAGVSASAPALIRLLAPFGVAVALFALLTLKIVRAQRANRRSWTVLRILAEAVKSEAWSYVMRAPPYAASGYADDPAGEARSDETFIERLRSLRASGAPATNTVRMNDTAVEQITSSMRATRQEDFDTRRRTYLNDRLDGQIGWYTRKARFHAARASQWFWFSLLAEALAIVAAFLLLVPEARPLLGILGLDPVGPLVTAATGAIAWSQSRDHERLATTYPQTCQSLIDLRTAFERVTDEERMGALVEQTERIMAGERAAWVQRAEAIG